MQGKEGFKGELSAHLRDFCEDKGIKNAWVIIQSAYEYDLAVVLFWENERQPVKTREGLYIANYLEQFGSVNHAVWTVFSEVNDISPRQSEAKESAKIATRKSHEYKVISM